MKELVSSVSPNGQVAIPVEIRKFLGLNPKDKVAFRVEGEEVKLTPVGSRLAASYKGVPSLKHPIGFKEMTQIAGGEHVQEAAKEGANSP